MRPVTRGQRNPLYFTLGKRLKEARKATGLARIDIARLAGVSHPVISRIEGGAVPGVDIAEALALALGISPCHLAYGIPLESASTGLQAPGIGERLRLARMNAALSVNALAKAAGLSHTAVGNIEAGKVLPGVDVAELLAKALEVSPCWLAFGEDGPGGLKVPPPIKRHKPQEPERRRRAYRGGQ